MLSIIISARSIFLCFLFLPYAHGMQSNTNLTFTLGQATAAGARHSGANEDRFTHFQEGNFACFAIFDGHNGCQAVDYAAANLHRSLYNACIKDKESPCFDDETIIGAYAEIGEECLRGKFKDSGATATSVIFNQTRPDPLLTVASIGDSSGILIDEDGFKVLSFSHRIDNPNEIERIKNHRPLKRKSEEDEAIPKPFKRRKINFDHEEQQLLLQESGQYNQMESVFLPSLPMNLDASVSKAPFSFRFNLEENKENIPPLPHSPKIKKNPTSWCNKIGVTRCFGHQHLNEKGLIHTPEIRHVPLSHRNGIIVLYTDGIGDILNPKKISNFVAACLNKGMELKAIAQSLLLEAAKSSPGRLYPDESDEQLLYRLKDDMTVAIVRFNEAGTDDAKNWALPIHPKQRPHFPLQ